MNSLLLASEMYKKSVQFEMHIYLRGGHGLALANEFTTHPKCRIYSEVQTLVKESITFLNNVAFKE